MWRSQTGRGENMIEITIVGYTITINNNGGIWIKNPEGEGMGPTQQQLKELLDKFWKENF